MSGIKYLNFIADIYGVPGMEREERGFIGMPPV